MPRKESRVTKIVRLTSMRYPSLYGVEEIVRFVLAKLSALENSERRKIGDDARDHINTAYFLNSLSDKALCEIGYIGRNEIHRRLRKKIYPFSRLNKKTREILLHLPNSWVPGAADRILRFRKAK